MGQLQLAITFQIFGFRCSNLNTMHTELCSINHVNMKEIQEGGIKSYDAQNMSIELFTEFASEVLPLLALVTLLL